MATKTFISPSDLTFGWSNCHRCLWLKYNEGLSAPVTMPLVGTLSALQEAHYRHYNTQQVNPVLPAGSIVGAGDWVVSAPIVVNGEPTEFRIRGKYDLLAQFDDERFGVIDCKVSASESNKSDFYQPQLEAYAFALESPESGAARLVSHLGLLVWTPSRTQGAASEGYSFGVDAYWQPIARNPQGLQNLLTKFIGVITLDSAPDAASTCRDCAYVTARRSLGI